MGWRDHLQEQFGDRVTFDPVEREKYRWDAGRGRRAPADFHEAPWAVVEPESVAELVRLTRLASRYRLPLVPRGAGTGCHGGSMPLRGGIVVLFRRMNRLLEVDAKHSTARVEAGLVIRDLARHLSPYHLTLRIYPTSAAEATIGGWVAEGGAGIGSYEFGRAVDNLEAVTLVTPQGEIRQLREDDLQLVGGAQGITGFIADLTLKVAPLEARVPVVAEFDSLVSLAEAIQEVGRRQLDIWHVGFLTDRQRLDANVRVATGEREAALARQPGGEEATPGGGTGAGGSRLPPSSPARSTPRRRRHLAFFVYPVRRRALGAALEAAALRWNGRLLSREEAEAEWAGRFQLMSLRRQAPFLEPGQAYVPLEHLGLFLEQLELRRPEYVTQGVLIDRRTAAVLSCGPAEQVNRREDAAVGEIAAATGGKAYSPGLPFIGAEGSYTPPGERLRRFKKRHDPHHLFNPGKILPDLVRPGPVERLLGENPLWRLRQWLARR